MALRENLMPIGRFSRSCRLSIKALRYYDEEGLLRPAYVDAATGYRYYARSQARDAIVISMLRSLGVGLPAIRQVLAASGGARASLLETEIRRLEQEIAKRESAVQTIQRIVGRGELLPYEIALRTEAPVIVARRAVATTAEALVPDTTALIYALFEELHATDLGILPPVLCMNEEARSGDQITVHACVGLASPRVELPEAEVDELEGGTFAWLTHRGPYEELGLAYHAIHAWAQERGHEQAGLIREIYVNDPADVPPDQLVTEVLFPIA